MNNQQIAHNWANQTREKQSGSNFYFKGTKLYSYGSHYLLGNLFPDHDIALINSNGYSSTTAKHKNYARRALSSRWTMIEVPKPEAETAEEHRQNIDYLLAKVDESLKAIKTARVKLGALLFNMEAQRDSVKLYAREFRVKSGIIPGLSSKDKQIYTVKAQEYKTRAEASAIKKAARLAAAEVVDLEAWRNGSNEKRYFSNSAIALRLSADKKRIETSRGAEVGILTAKEAFKRYKSGENMSGQALNGFTINEVGAEVVVIGCHEIPLTEIEKIMEVIK